MSGCSTFPYQREPYLGEAKKQQPSSSCRHINANSGQTTGAALKGGTQLLSKSKT
jgi:hypothetical protein